MDEQKHKTRKQPDVKDEYHSKSAIVQIFILSSGFFKAYKNRTSYVASKRASFLDIKNATHDARRTQI
jgi:hypothetical protein